MKDPTRAVISYKVVVPDACLTGYWHASVANEPIKVQTGHGHYIEGTESDGTLYSYPVTHDHKRGYRVHEHPEGALCELTPSAIAEFLSE